MVDFAVPEFFNILPIIAIIAITGVLAFIALMWYRAHAAPGPGIVLGSYTVNGRYAGQRLHKKIEGIVVDVTGLFCAPEFTDAFKNLLSRDIDKMIKKEEARKTACEKDQACQDEKEKEEKTARAKEEIDALKQAKEDLLKLDFFKLCRVCLVRDGNLFGDKHLLVQLGAYNRALSEYASHEEESHFTLAFGPVSKGLINGQIQTLPQQYDFNNDRFKLGTCTVSIIRPDDPYLIDIPQARAPPKNITPPNALPPPTIPAAPGAEQKPTVDVSPAGDNNATLAAALVTDSSTARSFAKIVAIIPNAFKVDEELKSKDQQIKDKDRANAEMGRQLSAMSNEVDYLRRAVKGFLTEGMNLADLMPKKLDVLDFAVLMLFTMIGLGAGNYLGQITGAAVGTAVGTAASAIIIYKRH